jgi:esterase/lipase
MFYKIKLKMKSFSCFIISPIIIIAFCCTVSCTSEELPEKYGQVGTQLYVGAEKNQALLVGLGGSEGGNAWTSDYWKKTREQMLDSGYALLALEYFGGPNSPEQLDRIAIDSVYKAIKAATAHPMINGNKIALIGGSKGAELALLLASKYPDIDCVVSIVGSHATFPALTFMASTSSWIYQGKEVAYVPLPWSAVPALLKQDLRTAFSEMLTDTAEVQKSLIDVNVINGSILMVSATKDEMWPSTEMSEEIMRQLKENDFSHPYQHIAIAGSHQAPLQHFDTIIHFLNKNFK